MDDIQNDNIIIRIWINCYFFDPALRLLVTVQTYVTNKNNQVT